MYKIYPFVKRIEEKDEYFLLKDKVNVFFEEEMNHIFKEIRSFVSASVEKRDDADICFLIDRALKTEAYQIDITPKGVVVKYNDYSGAYYAVKTLKQIWNQSTPNIKTVSIFDEPDLKVRGFMMDISRNKVPTMETIKKIIDMMSDLKMNHLELYVEGFSFEYLSFQKYLLKDGYISIQEFQELEQYALERAIDLVPNQNGFGHMAKWLEQDEFKDLAECPEGIFLWGRDRAPSTLNPQDERSVELVKKMYHDMLPLSGSKYFNMNFDEPFELGKGKSKEVCEKEGLGNVYIDFVLKAYEEIKKYNKTPLIWGDVLIKHPDLLGRLPKDMIFIDWGYDGVYPFRSHFEKLKEKKIKFIAAPGTTTWCSVTGRTADWVENISNAVHAVYEFDGEGVILTDWGDVGHLQFLPFTYAPLVFSGLLSWRVKEGTYFVLKEYLNKYIFQDRTNLLADTILDLGNYYRYENYYLTNGTPSFYGFMWAYYASKEKTNQIEYFLTRTKYHIVNEKMYNMRKKFLNQKIEEIQFTEPNSSDGELIKKELLQSILLLKCIHKVMASLSEEDSLKSSDGERKRRKRFLEEVIAARGKLVDGQKQLWLSRNKQSNLDDSIDYLEGFVNFAEMALEELIRRGEENG